MNHLFVACLQQCLPNRGCGLISGLAKTMTNSASLDKSSFNFLKRLHGCLNPFALSIIQELGIRSSARSALLWISKEFSNNPFCAINTSLSKAPFDAGELDLQFLSFGFFAGDIKVEDFDACLCKIYISK